MELIRVAIVEDEQEFQEWIQEEIEDAEDVVCVGSYDLAEDALQNLPQLKPDIVIMDLGLAKSEINGIECMLRLKIVSPEMKFLVLSAQSDENQIFEALRVGAGAYIQKAEIADKLIDRLREFQAGGAPMSPGIARMVIQSFHKEPEDLMQLKTLAPRERETLDQLAMGFLYKEVADKMSISEGTVKQYAHSIYKKLQVNNLVEAIRKYLFR